MKFIASLIALFLFFAFALLDAAQGITYSPVETTIAATQPEPANENDLTVAQTPREEKAGFSF
jgi:hypothetical protein